MRHRFPAHAVAALASLLLAACSKDEPAAPARPKAATAATAPAAAPAAPGEVDSALRERLARQEAAAKMFDRKPDAPKPAEAPRPEPAKPEAKTVPPAKAPEPPPAAAIKVPEPRPQPRSEPRSVEPPKVAAAPASAPPASVPTPVPPAAAPAAPPRVIARVDPEFPREAVQAGADRGSVKARMTLDAAGNVTRVEILEANPRRVFDRAVTRALTQWRFDDGAAGRTVETEVAFQR